MRPLAVGPLFLVLMAVSPMDLKSDPERITPQFVDSCQRLCGANLVWLNQSGPQAQPKLILDLVFPEPFGRVGPLREFSDGRVLVPDPLGQVLVIVDFDSETADTLGRSGEGPQEYQQPDAVFPLRGDTTLLVDLGNARMAVMAPNGIFLETLPMGQQTAGGGLIVAVPRGADRDGRLYFRSELQPMGSYPDSAALLRFDPGTRVLDTLALLKVPELPPPPLPGGGGSRGKAAEPQDDWAVGADGQIFLVREGDYRATWISVSGQLTHGPPNRFEGVRLRREEKARWLDEFAGSQVSMSADESGNVSVSRGGNGSGVPSMDQYEWPNELPAVKPGRTFVTSGEEAWVERFVSSDEAPHIDRFDGSGKKVGEIRLPEGRRVAGFGENAVFLVFKDQFDLEWLERYRIQPGADDAIEACTAFALHTDERHWVGKNLDWEVEDGIVVLNQRGVAKKAWAIGEKPTFSWISRFGSVSFNQFGWGFPLGGINEAGLVVEELSYSPSRYPGPDERPAINELQWIQYQLDNAASVEEVLASDTLIRIEKFLFGLHYMVADREGSVAVVEFLDGKRVVYTGDDLPVQVLANDTYRNLVRYLAHHEGFGGSRVVSDGPESPERFVRAATLLKDVEGIGEGSEERSTTRNPSPFSPLSPQEFTFNVLESVKQDDTQWSVAYDLNGGEVSFKTQSLPSTRTLSLDSLDFSCRRQDLILPLSVDAQPLVPGGGQHWTTRENQGLVNLVFSKLRAVLPSDELPTWEVLEDLGNYPATARCASGR